MMFKFFRRQRSAYFDWEWHDHNGVRYFNVTVGSPTHHRWWAFDLYVYL